MEYKRPARAYPFRDFHKICKVCTPFQDALAVKITLDLLKGLWSYGGFKLTGSGYPQIFIAPIAAKLCIRPPKVLELQERARGPLSPCQVWLLLDFIHRWAAKNVKFFLFFCLSVHPAFERQCLCARFRHEGVGIQKQFLCRWIGEGL